MILRSRALCKERNVRDGTPARIETEASICDRSINLPDWLIYRSVHGIDSIKRVTLLP